MSKSTVSPQYTESSLNHFFRKFATKTSSVVGSPIAFAAGLILIIIWAITGPLFNYSNTWQLAVNTGTTISTFLIVFLIQNTQNRDAKALHLKIDELIRSSKGARNSLLNIEDEDDVELIKLQDEFKQFKDHYTERLQIIEKLHKQHHLDSP